MKRTSLKTTMLLLVVLALTGCSDRSSDAAPTTLAGQTWRLIEITNIKGVKTVATTEFFSANFTADGKLSGTASCNTYSANYMISETGEISLSSFLSTLVYCGEDSLIDQYYAGLQAAHSYAVSEGRLTLSFAQQGQLVFVVQGPD